MAYKHRKLATIIILVIVTILIAGITATKFFTTVYSVYPNPPNTLEECHQIDGITIPSTQDCKAYTVEFGNAGKDAICCVPDTCQGNWTRIYNAELRLFEKVCKQ